MEISKLKASIDFLCGLIVILATTMAERPRRGRPPKNREAASQQPDQNQDAQNAVSQPEAAPATPPVPQVDVEEIVGSTTHTFLKALYKDARAGAELDAAYLEVHDTLSQLPDPRISFNTLYSLTGLVVREARDRQDDSMAEKFTNRQRGFRSALDRLNPASATSSPTNPSNLPPMTGRKG